MYKTNDVVTPSNERIGGGNLNMDLVNFEDVAHVTTEEYFNNNQMCINVFQSKYAHHISNEDRKETPPEVFKRNARELARFESDDSYEKIWFSLMYNDWFRPGGSIISGLGSGRNESLLNCLTLPINGDTLEDIAETEYSLMKCAAFRQGIGIDLSPLRYRGSKVGNAAEESMGVVPWGKKFSNVGLYVGQRGRMPALLESLLISHPDIEEFITAKMNKGELENCNISVQITDDFMDCLRNGKPWKIHFSTHRDSFEKEIDPEYLIDLIADTAAKSAEPGVQFIDLMRSGSMVHSIYKTTGDDRFKIISSNACLPDFATVLTPEGIREFKDIDIGSTIWSGKQWTQVVNKWHTGVKPVYKYITSTGEFIGTEDHKVISQGEREEVRESSCIDVSWSDPSEESYNFDPQTVMDGLVIGDGSIHNNLVYLNVGDNDYDYFNSEVKDLFIRERPTINDYAWEVYTTIKREELPYTYERSVPERFFTGNEQIAASFLRGLFSANGFVVGKRAGLKQTSFTLIKQVQQMLSSIGIRSYVTYNKGKSQEFRNGIYEMKPSYDLNIYVDRDIFLNKVGFLQGYKQNNLNQIVLDRKFKGNSKKSYDITHVEYLGDYDVYDITVEAPEHTFWTGGCLVSNCCLPESERIFTDRGLVTVREIKNNKNFNSITDEGTANIEEVVAQGVRPIYNLKTKEGVELKVTDNHKIKTTEGLFQLKDLKHNQKLNIPYNDVVDNSKVNDFNYKLGFILGFIIGDGYLASQHKTFGFSVSDDDPKTYEYLKNCFLEVFDYDITARTYKKYGCSQVVAGSANLYDKFKEYGLFPCKSHEKEPPEVVFYDPSVLKGFMCGLFQADGCVNYKHSNSLYVSLDSSSFKLTKEIQQLLLYFGIRSMLYENRRNGKTSTYIPDSQRESKLYNVKEITSLRITSGDIKKFNEHIGFINGSPKDEKINDIISTKNIFPSKNCLTFVGYEYVGEEPVYDLVNSSTKTFTANGIVVSNSEKPLPPYGCCNLGSINMEKFSTDPKEYKKQLAEIVPYLVRLLDDVVDYEIQFDKSPLEKQKWILEQTRELGLGITNLHGWLLKQDLQYDSDEAIDKAEDFFKTYVYHIFKTSVELGREKGSAPAFTSSKDLYENSVYFKNVVDEFYDGDYTQIDALRNLAHISIAPTGSLSNTFSTPCIASGVEPIIGPYYWRKTRAVTKGTYEYYFVIPERVKEYILKQIPEDSEDYQKLNEFTGSVKDDDGKIGKEYVELLQKYISDEFFKPAHQIDYYKKIELMSRLYQFTDAAISCTFNLPPSTTKEDVQNIYLYAYDKGVKAVSVYVEGSREGILIFDDPITHKNKQDKQNLLCLDRPEDIVYHCAPKRPKSLDCDIHHCTVKGEKWLVLVGMLNGKPYELFCGTQEDLYLPRSVTSGTITKEKGQYNLSIQNKRTSIEYKDIADILMTAEQKALTRMISLSLRHGVPLEFITKQLRKSKNDITDFASAVSRVLGKYETQDADEGEECPNCGELMIKREGCIQCSNENCGYSKCS